MYIVRKSKKVKQNNCASVSVGVCVLPPSTRNAIFVYTTQKQLTKEKGKRVDSCGLITDEVRTNWVEGYCEENYCLKIPILLLIPVTFQANPI